MLIVRASHIYLSVDTCPRDDLSSKSIGQLYGGSTRGNMRPRLFSAFQKCTCACPTIGATRGIMRQIKSVACCQAFLRCSLLPEYKINPEGEYLGHTTNFTQGRTEPMFSQAGRVNKCDLAMCLRESAHPYEEETLARAYIDTRDDMAYEKPRILLRIGEDHVEK